MIQHTDLFDYGFELATGLDIGKRRQANQDQVIACPELGFFAVSDGMGGLAFGAETSDMIARVLPGFVAEAAKEIKGKNSNSALKGILRAVKTISDQIYEACNTSGYFSYGATLCCVWLIGNQAVFVNLGDSRGYHLPKFKRTLRQVTDDHNIAGIKYRNGLITKQEAQNDPSSSGLTRFVGMEVPALPDSFIVDIAAGDRLLLCSDGLYGLVDESGLRLLMRSSRSPERVVNNLIAAANENGGRDNISAVYIKIAQ